MVEILLMIVEPLFGLIQEWLMLQLLQVLDLRLGEPAVTYFADVFLMRRRRGFDTWSDHGRITVQVFLMRRLSDCRG